MKKKSKGMGCIGFIIMIPFLPFIIPLAIIGTFLPFATSSNRNKNSKGRFTEAEMEAYGLWEDEKELVRKGEYDPWDFEENEMLEDDDYYKE